MLDVSLVNMIFVDKTNGAGRFILEVIIRRKECDTCEKCDKSTNEILFKRAQWNPCTERMSL